MSPNRREWIVLTVISVASAVVEGCAADSGNSPEGQLASGTRINIGNASDYRADGDYDQFLKQGVLIRSVNGKLLAISAICTHRKCGLKKQQNGQLHCKCHGSVFASDGKVLEGPAKRDLPNLPIETDENGTMYVTT